MRRSPFLVLLLLLAACAAPAPVVVPPPPPPVTVAPTAPAYQALLVRGGSLVRTGLTQTVIADDVESVSGTFPGPEGTLVAVQRADSTTLYLSDGSAVRRIHSVEGSVVYTASWAPDGSGAAFAYYRPTGNDSPGRPGMGAGDILRFDAQGVRRVGCSASRAVLAWDGTERLLVRNTDNLYVVAVEGCSTVSTVDARRMHGLTASPDGGKLAFVHRELEYNRTTRAYEADSTFRLTNLDGSDAKTIVSFRYRPRNLSWRPDGQELAFDVAAGPDVGRAISIFSVDLGTTAFLHPPASGGPDEFAPVWSPAGDRIAYLRGDQSGAYNVWVRSFDTSFPESIDGTEGATILGWVGADAVAFRRYDGTVAVFAVGTQQVQELGSANAVGHIWRNSER